MINKSDLSGLIFCVEQTLPAQAWVLKKAMQMQFSEENNFFPFCFA